MRLSPFVAILLAVPATTHAQRFFAWHVMESPVPLHKRLDLIVHQRTRLSVGPVLDQVRTGPVLRWKAFPSTTLIAGYYWQPQHTPDDLWVRGHRFFTGIETSRPAGSLMTWTGRVAMERFHATGRPDYSRYRTFQRLIIGEKWRVSPYLQNEVLAVRQGFHSTRNSGGVRARITPVFVLEAGFLYDSRRTVWGGDRYAIVTGIRWQPLHR